MTPKEELAKIAEELDAANIPTVTAHGMKMTTYLRLCYLTGLLDAERHEVATLKRLRERDQKIFDEITAANPYAQA